MVMEPPSPQCVGREFVRQYYTVLNKAPTLLHRFYSKNSSFVHGGLDHPGAESKPVIGQVEIHQKILQLNFCDCHAKIRQVDSHETLEQGVVVQVTGELSNNGQPMRRFMQTFVLAPQTPKQFYVRNDIFRYQDEVFNDDDETDNQESTIGTEDQNHQANINNQDLVKTIQYYDAKEIVRNGTSHLNESELAKLSSPLAQRPSTPPRGTTPPFMGVPLPQRTATTPPRGTTPSFIGTVALETKGNTPEPIVVTAAVAPRGNTPPRGTTPPFVSTGVPRETASSKSDWDSVEDEEEDDEADEEEEEIEQEHKPNTIETHEITNTLHNNMEPKTYANMVSKNTPTGFTANSGAGGPSVPPAFGQQTPLHHNQMVVPNGSKPEVPFPKLEQQTSPPSATHVSGPTISNQDSTPPESDSSSTNANNSTNNNGSNAGHGYGTHYQHHGSHFQQSHRGMRGNRVNNGPMRNNGNRFDSNRESFTGSVGSLGSGGNFASRLEESSNDGEKRKPQYPDSQQLFVGNLPHTIGEEELKKIFDTYGTVIDARINTKPNMKTGPGGKGQVPNFGFVVFEDSDAVQKALSQKPVHYNNHRLNVEEKKTKARMGGGNEGGGGGNRMVSSGGRGGMMSQRGGGMNNNRGRGGGMQGLGRGDSRGGGRGGPGGGANLRR